MSNVKSKNLNPNFLLKSNSEFQLSEFFNSNNNTIVIGEGNIGNSETKSL